MIELSKTTAKLQHETRLMLDQVSDLIPAIESTRTASGDIDALAVKIGTLSAKRDILTNRLSVKRGELLEAFVEDARKIHKTAKAAFEKAEREYRDQVSDWKAVAKKIFPVVTAKAISDSPAALPISVQDARRKRDDARRAVEVAGGVLVAVDNEYRKTVIGATSGKPIELPMSVRLANASQWLPELDPGPVASPGHTRVDLAANTTSAAMV